MQRILIAGATGKMGQEAIKLVEQKTNFALGAILAPTADNASLNLAPNVRRFTTLEEITGTYDIWLDFTIPEAVFANTQFAINHHIRPLIGTSGLTTEQILKLQQLARQQKVGGLIAANFSLSAVLLMKFAHEAARYFPDAEIIELHHADKKDAPSTTALSTAQQINNGRQKSTIVPEASNPARGLVQDNVAIHAVRLPGYVAHEEVLFGAPGEALSIRQDSFQRSSFMSGVSLALDQIDQLQQLVVGLEHIL